MKLYVVRHAHAGSRSRWTADDRLRPLSHKGWRQATALAAELGGAGIRRLVSSPSLRCIETLRPLADELGLVIEDDDRLAEGSDGEAALALAEELRRCGDDDDATAVCSHGDVIPDLLWELRGSGTAFHHPLTWPKGSVWLLTGNGTHWSDARYVPVVL
ncbi:MAG: SixA phosphatase family protein [Acidimicrobiales bacterium]